MCASIPFDTKADNSEMTYKKCCGIDCKNKDLLATDFYQAVGSDLLYCNTCLKFHDLTYQHILIGL